MKDGKREGEIFCFQSNAPVGSRIDYIFVSDRMEVRKYGVLTDSYDQRYPSDHLPVVIRAVVR